MNQAAVRAVLYAAAGAAGAAALGRALASAYFRLRKPSASAPAPAAPAAKAGPLAPGGGVYRTAEKDVAIHASGWIDVPGVGRMTARPLVTTEGGGLDWARGTASDAERWAEKVGGVLPSPAELDAYAAHVVKRWGASHRLAPVLLVQTKDDARGMASRAFAVRHDERVRAQVAERGIPDGDPIVNVGKHWADDPAAPAGRATNHGWWREGAPPIQNAGHAHNDAHVDYSQTVIVKASTPPEAA